MLGHKTKIISLCFEMYLNMYIETNSVFITYQIYVIIVFVFHMTYYEMALICMVSRFICYFEI